MSSPLVGIVVGSESDRPRMQAAMDRRSCRTKHGTRRTPEVFAAEPIDFPREAKS